ncbi:MAG: TetR/AcrR family transcriptional regulator [Lachnospiraceae bacterium]|nr:TetR/AcrR family transcriptional regulator [Lachnospiraceae bacterium]
MGEKSGLKRNHILECARQVFAEKGFRDVTMQDIVLACDISRGGLYLHFTRVDEIFAEVMKMDQESGDDGGALSLPEQSTPTDILALFMKEQKKEILRKKNSLSVAVYEYYFYLSSKQIKIPAKENILKQQFETGVLILENLIRDGLVTGEFYCEDPRGMASNIMYTLEGLKVTARTLGISEALVDKELVYIVQNIVFEE